MALASIDCVKSLRIVPAAALAGSVAPMTSRSYAIAPSRSSTLHLSCPVVHLVHCRLAKNAYLLPETLR